MKQYVFEVLPRTGRVSLLRFLAEDGRIIGQRELVSAEVQAFVDEVERGYQQGRESPDLADLGRRLYEWLNGPTERWLGTARGSTVGLVIHIDVAHQLRHLPWELLFTQESFLCADIHRPFTPVRRVSSDQVAFDLANRPLRILFMACSPEHVEPVLDFEAEEGRVLTATRRPSIDLVVEERGSLAGLEEQVQGFGPRYFDVLHLTGHAGVKRGKPCFVMEDDLGFAHEATAEEIARAFSGNWPRLVFLSGCKTGQAVDQGALPSLCEDLVSKGAPAVLGWALPVGDVAASIAAAALYEELAIGKRADEAVAKARQKLLEEKSGYWHLLRLYANATPLSEFVTPLQTPGRERLRVREAQAEFLDAGAKVEVCPRARFVGRRRPIQRCLRVLKSRQGEPEHAEGVLVHSMSGLGKSSMAARLCERMPTYRRLVWHGQIDEREFLHVVAGGLDDPDVIRILNEPRLTLTQRLRRVFGEFLATKPILFVFDDFEHNLDLSNGAAKLNPEVLDILNALLTAIRATMSESRVIVTTRYTFPLAGPVRLYSEGLESMRNADLQKKVEQLPALHRIEQTDKDLRDRAIALTAGNPRLLDRLDRVLVDLPNDHTAVPSTIEKVAKEFREEIHLPGLLRQQTPPCRRLLALLSIYDIPVNRAAVEAVASGEPLASHLERAASVGLVESGKDAATGASRYYVSRIVRPLVDQEISDEERREACGRGARHLYQTLWPRRREGTSPNQALEIRRLALSAGEKDIAEEVGNAFVWLWVASSPDGEKEHGIITELSDAERWLELLNQSPSGLEWQDAGEEAAAFARRARRLAERGDVERALKLWRESLRVFEQIGDLQWKAAILVNMAYFVGMQGDLERARRWNLEAAQIRASICDWPGLVSVLLNLGASNNPSAAAFLAQALLLSHRFKIIPVEDAVQSAVTLCKKLGLRHEMTPLIAAAGYWLARLRFADDPKGEEMQQEAGSMLMRCARERRISNGELNEWFARERLNEADHVLCAVVPALVAIVGDSWLFDPQLLR